MNLDIEDDGLFGASGGRGKKRRNFIDGPSNLIDILDINKAGAKHMLETARLAGNVSWIANITEFVKRDIVLSSTFTGYGTFEDTFWELRLHLAELLDVEVGKTVWYHLCVQCRVGGLRLRV